MIRSAKGHWAFYSCQAANRSNIWISGQGLKCILLKPKLKHKKAHGLVKPDLMSPSHALWGRENGAGVEWISDICLLWEETLSKAILGVTASENLSSEELQKGTLLSLGQGQTENEPFKMKINPGQYSEISSHLYYWCFFFPPLFSCFGSEPGVHFKRSLIVNSWPCSLKTFTFWNLISCIILSWIFLTLKCLINISAFLPKQFIKCFFLIRDYCCCSCWFDKTHKLTLKEGLEQHGNTLWQRFEWVSIMHVVFTNIKSTLD